MKFGGMGGSEVFTLADVLLEIEEHRRLDSRVDELPVADARGVLLTGSPEELVMRNTTLLAVNAIVVDRSAVQRHFFLFTWATRVARVVGSVGSRSDPRR